MAVQQLVPDALWEIIEQILPHEPPKTKGGRPRIPARQVLGGIIFVLRTGIPWEYLPQELGFGSGMTCWRKLRYWQQTGVWERLHHELLSRLHGTGASTGAGRRSTVLVSLPGTGVITRVRTRRLRGSGEASATRWCTGPGFRS